MDESETSDDKNASDIVSNIQTNEPETPQLEEPTTEILYIFGTEMPWPKNSPFDVSQGKFVMYTIFGMCVLSFVMLPLVTSTIVYFVQRSNTSTILDNFFDRYSNTINLEPEQYARKFACPHYNCTKDLKSWSTAAFIEIEKEWKKFEMLNNDIKKLWIPLNSKTSINLEKEWRRIYGKPMGSYGFCSLKFTDLYHLMIPVMNYMYYASIYENFTYLKPIYWKKESEVWLVIRSEWIYEVPEIPPVLYFSETIRNNEMKSFFQPVPPWYMSPENDIKLSHLTFHHTDLPMQMAFDDAQIPQNLIFVIHGIGHHTGEEGIVKNTLDIRDGFINFIKKFHHGYDIPFLLPIAWRHPLALNDEMIRTVPLLKGDFAKNVGIILNDVLYYKSDYKDDILTSAVEELNSQYKQFKKRHHNFNGNISILAHSLGSVITFDILQKPKKLDFEINNVFLIGSSLGRFLASDGIDAEIKLRQNPWVQNGKFFNIFHSDDPVAHRLEPLFNMNYKFVEPFSLHFPSLFRNTFSKSIVVNKREKKDVSKFHSYFVYDRQLTFAHDSFLQYTTMTKSGLHKSLNTVQKEKEIGFEHWAKIMSVFKNIIHDDIVLTWDNDTVEAIPLKKRLPHRIDYDLFKIEYSKFFEDFLTPQAHFASWSKDVLFTHMSYWNRPEVIGPQDRV